MIFLFEGAEKSRRNIYTLQDWTKSTPKGILYHGVVVPWGAIICLKPRDSDWLHWNDNSGYHALNYISAYPPFFWVEFGKNDLVRLWDEKPTEKRNKYGYIDMEKFKRGIVK